MRLLTICIMICFFTTAVYPENTSSEEVYSAITEAITLRHSNVRIASLTSIKQRSNLSDDEFSALLVRASEEFKTGKTPGVRGFALAALYDFGTTNAIDYVKNEAMHGPSSVNGMKLYCLLTGFDKRCFELASKVFSCENPEIQRRKRIFCGFLYSIITSPGEYSGRKIPETAREKALQYIRSSAENDKNSPSFFDDLLLKVDPEYPNSELRKRRVIHFAETLTTNAYDYAYFQTELAKIKKAALEAERKTDEAAIEKTETESNLWFYSLIALAVALSITAGIALRKNSGSAR